MKVVHEELAFGGERCQRKGQVGLGWSALWRCGWGGEPERQTGAMKGATYIDGPTRSGQLIQKKK